MSGLPDTRDYQITDTTGEYMRLVLKISAESAETERLHKASQRDDPIVIPRGAGCFPEEFFQ